MGGIAVCTREAEEPTFGLGLVLWLHVSLFEILPGMQPSAGTAGRSAASEKQSSRTMGSALLVRRVATHAGLTMTLDSIIGRLFMSTAVLF